MSASLVGSEMCIRDSNGRLHFHGGRAREGLLLALPAAAPRKAAPAGGACLLYTSDAADDM
eukprot:13805539-Alexandrium_andersonii.AAC.1